MEFLRKDRVGFYFGNLIIVVIGWLGGANGFLFSLAPFLLFAFLLWRNRMYDELLLGFLFTLVLSDNLPEQFVGLTYAKQLKNIYILFLTLVLIVDRKNFAPLNNFVFKFLPFFLIAAIALYASQQLELSVQKTLSYFLLFIVIPGYVSRGYRENGEAFFKRIVHFLLFVVLLCLAMKYLVPSAGLSHGARLRGIFGNPNGFGVFLTLAIIVLTIVKNQYPNSLKRSTISFAYLILFVAAFWTGSRSALLGMMLFLLFVRIFKFSSVLGFIGFIGVLFFINSITDLTISLIIELGLGDTFRIETLEEGSGRFLAWNFAWERIQDYFFIGRGFGYDEHLMRSNFNYLSRLGHEGGVHNTYLILWLNTGLIGLAMFLRGFFLNFISAAKKTNIALPVMFTVMFSIMFEPWLAASLNPYTSLFLIALIVMTQEEFYIHETAEEIHEKEKEDLQEALVSV